MKGISPLFGIILIVIFSLIVASIFVFLLRSFLLTPEKAIFPQVPKPVEITPEEIICMKGSIWVNESTIECDFTGTKDKLQFEVKNTGSINLHEIKAQLLPEITQLVYEYEVIDLLSQKPFLSDNPLEPNTSRKVKVNITEDLPPTKLKRLRITTSCSDVSDVIVNVDCTSLPKLTIPSYTVALGSRIDLPISIIGAEKIAAGIVKILFDNSVVNVVDVKAGDFGTPIYNLKNEEGFVKIAVVSPTASGKSKAVLAIITVEVIGEGRSQLSLVEQS